jgi:hypothetical protein
MELHEPPAMLIGQSPPVDLMMVFDLRASRFRRMPRALQAAFPPVLCCVASQAIIRALKEQIAFVPSAVPPKD